MTPNDIDKISRGPKFMKGNKGTSDMTTNILNPSHKSTKIVEQVNVVGSGKKISSPGRGA